MNAPRLIVTADDCGLSEAINYATLDLHRQGYLNAASVMTNFPAHEHALGIFRDCPDLDVGAHLTLTDGMPVSIHGPHHSHLLRDDRSFRDKFSLYLRALFFSKDTIVWIRQELDAQLARFTAAGMRPQHISTHHHFHSLPNLRKIVYELAADYQVAWVRGHDFRATMNPHVLLPHEQHQPQNERFYMPNYVTAIQAWMKRPVRDFAQRVAALSGTVEIVAHPAPAIDEGFPPSLNYGTAPRFHEAQYLMAAMDLLRQQGINLA